MARKVDSTDAIGFAVNFAFGVVIGALSGVGLWWFCFLDVSWGWLAIPANALLVGLLGGIFGDRFWTVGVQWFNWW